MDWVLFTGSDRGVAADFHQEVAKTAAAHARIGDSAPGSAATDPRGRRRAQHTARHTEINRRTADPRMAPLSVIGFRAL
ncbi:hypothetical protein [Streptomyces phaeochromogenes]|uniref:hypothetical protein n=1 Tax=Streptomyces phaeochromogenes TaxID=1923 RepID=UPI0033E7F898